MKTTQKSPTNGLSYEFTYKLDQIGSRRGQKKSFRTVYYWAKDKEKGDKIGSEIGEKMHVIMDLSMEDRIIEVYSFGTRLDVGCGFRKHGDLGIDIHKGRDADVIADACYLPFVDFAFDTLTANHVLEHIEDFRKAIFEMARVAANGVIVAVPKEEFSYSDKTHKHHLMKSEWRKILKGHFSIEEEINFGISNIFVCSKWQKRN